MTLVKKKKSQIGSVESVTLLDGRVRPRIEATIHSIITWWYDERVLGGAFKQGVFPIC